MRASRYWRDWAPPEAIGPALKRELTKPPDPSSVSFVSTDSADLQKFRVAVVREEEQARTTSAIYESCSHPGNCTASAIAIESEDKLTELPEPTSVSFGSANSGHPQKNPATQVPPHKPAKRRELFQKWLDADCVRDPRCSGGVRCLRAVYSEWEGEHGRRPCTRDIFDSLLVEMGFTICNVNGVILVRGLVLRPDFEAAGFGSITKVSV